MSRTGRFAAQIWRDGAARALPLWVVVTALNTSVLAGLIAFRAAGSELVVVPVHQLILTLWLPIAIYLCFGRVRTRCHRLELALPISARELWLSHSVAVAFSGALVLAASFGVLAVHEARLFRLPGGAESELALTSLMAPMGAGLLLALVLIQRLEPSAWRLSGGARYWTILVGGLVAVLGLLLGLGRWPVLAAGACLLLAGGLGVRAYLSLPPSFKLVPLAPRPARGAASAAAAAARAEPPAAIPERSAPPGTARLLRLVFATLHNAPPWKQWAPWLLYTFVLGMGVVLSGVLDLWIDFEEVRTMNIPMGSYMLLAGAGLLTYHLHRLDPLPLSRRLVFGVLTFPALLFFCLGWGAGRVLLATGAESMKLVDYRISGPQRWVEIDPGFMGMSWTGDAPILSSPWGESHRAWHRPLFRGGRAILYSPFNTPEQSSARFEALMTSRAVEAIYGEVIPHQEILDRYFVVEDDELVELRRGGFTLLEDYPALEAPPQAPETPVYLILVLVPWLLALALFVRSFRATAGIKLIRGVYWALLVAVLGAILGQVALTAAGWYNLAVGHAFLEILVRRLGGGAIATSAAWVTSVALILLSYRLAERQFIRSELPPSPIQCSWIDFGTGES